MEKPFLIGASFNNHRPGMKLYLHEDYKSLREGDIVTIHEMSGFDKERNQFEYPLGLGELFFVTTEGIKITWNKVSISCYIERDDTTSFLEKMVQHYKVVAERNLQDSSFEWNQGDYDQYLEEKYETLTELVLEYEYERIEKEKVTL
ncbi:hypothetical protein COK65_18705 [Bacillus thuringiensis]|uniref:Uncharacterized protein n=1 Tax=Bacillus thuringiensis subsp. medellin TaxID=79672 RepID=A0A9X6N3K0_BACTV|nr:hypothetical protein [Bacillus thuringiensis]OUC01057.1 hypothetical protein BK784_13535 [Bacillus thuringiensis serovar medellin]PFS40790.1 hypothetical protein COK65_18705 [Bacillus thuringiensis]